MSAGLPAGAAVTRSGDDERCMRRALEAARRAMLAGEPPIGACLVRDGEVLATASNSVISALDITAHAETVLIRDACRRQRTLELAGCELYTTVEPCPMCLAASHYARIGRIVYGASLADLHELTGGELMHVAMPGAAVRLEGGCLREESRQLLAVWAARNRP
ncbi:MAG: nucleoside deaminase [Gammaproteobacteria bacterium]|nr:nucleoside deaminase [Gammaproteobacteria bacterium]